MGWGAGWCLTSQNHICGSLLLTGKEVAAPFLKSSGGGLGSEKQYKLCGAFKQIDVLWEKKGDLLYLFRCG